jgi:hypothetical protein
MASAMTGPSRVMEQIGDAVKGGRCILFLGAGVHAPPPEHSPFAYPSQQRPAFAATLSRQLASGCEYAERFPRGDLENLQRVAHAYEIDNSRRELVDAIAAAVHEDKSPSPMLHALAKLDFPIVITTNYDRLFERALSAAGKMPRTTVYRPEREKTTVYHDASAESPVIYKLHGDIADRDSIVVTDEDYIQFVLRMGDKEPEDPIPLILKYHLTTSTTLFVGYSLVDYNLRLLFKTLRWKMDQSIMPAMYSVDRWPDPLILDVWQNQHRYVRFLAQDVWSFVPALYEQVTGEELSP